MSNFEEVFYPNLGSTRRWAAFQEIARLLSAKRKPLIVETGCLRRIGNWNGDGQSTVIWDWFGGEVFSVDIDPIAVETAQRACPLVNVTCGDSVDYLVNFKRAGEIDLLYLDSYDYIPGLDAAAEHHLNELRAIYKRLPHGCIIAVDDCFSPTEGKGSLVRVFLENYGVQPIHESYMTIWVKP
ncbi:MAG: hypothetical protein ACKN9R_05385 [Candidatus Limnocylindrus sp.]